MIVTRDAILGNSVFPYELSIEDLCTRIDNAQIALTTITEVEAALIVSVEDHSPTSLEVALVSSHIEDALRPLDIALETIIGTNSISVESVGSAIKAVYDFIADMIRKLVSFISSMFSSSSSSTSNFKSSTKAVEEKTKKVEELVADKVAEPLTSIPLTDKRLMLPDGTMFTLASINSITKAMRTEVDSWLDYIVTLDESVGKISKLLANNDSKKAIFRGVMDVRDSLDGGPDTPAIELKIKGTEYVGIEVMGGKFLALALNSQSMKALDDIGAKGDAITDFNIATFIKHLFKVAKPAYINNPKLKEAKVGTYEVISPNNPTNDTKGIMAASVKLRDIYDDVVEVNDLTKSTLAKYEKEFKTFMKEGPSTDKETKAIREAAMTAMLQAITMSVTLTGYIMKITDNTSTALVGLSDDILSKVKS